MNRRRYRSCSEDETRSIGRELATGLLPGALVCVEGDLGTGKSVLLRASAAALGVDEPMPSPSYTIVYEYLGDVPVLHVDLYRLGSEEEFDFLGLEEAMEESVTLLEWPERAPSLTARASVYVTIRWEEDGECRRIEITR